MIKRILVPIDFSSITCRVMAITHQQAKMSNAEVLLIHIEQPDPDFAGYKAGPDSVRHTISKEIHHNHQSLEALRELLQKKNIAVNILLVQGETVPLIISEAEQFKANLIIMGTRGKSSLKDLLLGSVTKGVLQHAHCPVLLVKRGSLHHYW
jgi:nucleotide-binding universal stress UspA family protein